LTCQEEMEQDREDRDRVPVEEWEEGEGVDGEDKGVLGPALGANAFAPSVGKKRPIKWARLAMSSDVPNAAPR